MQSPYALVAEPEQLQAATYQSLLAELGVPAVCVSTEAQARAVLQQRGAPVLLLLEPFLEEGDGLALLEALRALPGRPAPCVLVATAYDELRLLALQHQQALGIHALLPRSAPAEHMREALRRALERQPAAEEATRAPPGPAHEAKAGRVEPAVEGGELQELQGLVDAVAQAFGVPVAALALTHEGVRREALHLALPRQAEGLDLTAFHQVAEQGEPQLVPDTTRHPVLREQPLVLEGWARSYAGVLLLTPSGERLGTLFIAERRRHALGAEELQVLRGLAERMAGDMAARARVRTMELEASRLRHALEARPVGPGGGLEWLREALAALPVGTALSDGAGRVVAANAALAELLGLEPARLEGLALEALCQHVAGLGSEPQALWRQLEPLHSAPERLEATLELERPRRRVVRWVARPVPLPGGPGLLSTLLELAPAADCSPKER